MIKKRILVAVISALPLIAEAEQNETINLENITVTAPILENFYSPIESSSATRVESPLKETPVSVQVIDKNLIQERGFQSPNDLANAVSSVQPVVGYGNTASQYFIVRGFSNLGVNFRNGYRVSEAYTPHDLANVERVEFVKGPASVLYGASQPGGAVNTITKTPQRGNFGHLEVSAGSFDTYRTTLDANGEYADFSFRLNAALDKSDSYIDLESSDNWLLAPSVLWRINDKTNLLYEAEYQRTKRDAWSNGLPNLPEIKRADFDTTLAEPWNDFDNLNQNHHLEFNTEINDKLSFRQGFYDARAKRSINTVSPSFAGDPIGNGESITAANRVAYSQKRDNPHNTVSQTELKGKLDIGDTKHQWLAGFELSRAEFDFLGSFNSLDTINLINFQSGNVPEINAPANFGSKRVAKSMAIYLQDLVAWQDWRFQLGLRNERVKSSAKDPLTGDNPKQSESATTGRVGLLYLFTPQTSGYYSFSQSFVPNTNGRDASNKIFDAERGRQHEIGVKHTLLPGLETTVSLFDIRKKNVLVADPSNPTFSIENGEQTSRGWEVSLAGDVMDNLHLLANMSGQKAFVSKDPDQQGQRLFGVPRFSANVWGLYDINGVLPGKLSVGLGAIRVGEREAAQPNLSYFKLPSYNRFDAGIFYKQGAFNAALNLRNIRNEKILDSLEGVAVQIQAPFNATLSAGWDF